MLTTDDKKWTKDTINEVVHEKIAELIVDHIQPTLATKEDLGFELSKYATKNDLKAFRKEVTGKLNNIGNRLDLTSSKEDIDGLKELIDNLTGAIDHFMGKTNKIEDEQRIASHKIYKEALPKIEDHEKRIVKLESPHRASSPAV